MQHFIDLTNNKISYLGTSFNIKDTVNDKIFTLSAEEQELNITNNFSISDEGVKVKNELVSLGRVCFGDIEGEGNSSGRVTYQEVRTGANIRTGYNLFVS